MPVTRRQSAAAALAAEIERERSASLAPADPPAGEVAVEQKEEHEPAQGEERRTSDTSEISSTLKGESSGEPASSSSSSSSGDDSSNEDSESSASSDEESDEEDQDGADDAADKLHQLLLKAKQSARARAEAAKEAKGKRGGPDDDLAGGEEMVLFGGEEESEEESEEEAEDDAATPKASTSSRPSTSRSAALPPSLARPLSFPLPSALTGNKNKGKARATDVTLAQDLGGVLPRTSEEVVVVGRDGKRVMKDGGREDRFGKAPLPKLSKNAIRAKQPHTAGSKWFNMPATPMTPELKRDLDALRLSNALDPKKFMRAGAKKERVGEFFQVGHIIQPSTRATTLSTEQQGRVQKRSFIDELVSNEQQQAYAKKKTKEVMAKGMSGRKRQRARGGGGREMGGKGKKQRTK
ncbi:hypothetical protein JCM10213_002294 [Rhodosporidiobolus nylandii]